MVKSGYYKEAIGENFNLASGKEVSIKSMINMVNEAAGNKAQILLKPRRKWDTKPRLLASIEKANRLIHYEPLVNFEEGFRETLVWFKDNWEIIEKLADFTPGMSSAVG